MSQIGEPLAVGEIDEDEVKCPFAHEKPGEVKNELDAEGGKELGEGLEHGWSTRLWEQEAGTIKPKSNQVLVSPAPKSSCPGPPVKVSMLHSEGHMVEGEYPFSIAAHHLIPAKASLKKHAGLMQYISKTAKGSQVGGDVGYDINGGENGLWLPTHTALSQQKIELPGESSRIKYSSASKEGSALQGAGNFVDYYTEAVMDKTSRQFHDAHGQYNEFVLEVLEKIKCNLDQVSTIGCDKCKEVRKLNGKLPPPHALVSRLNSVSSRLRGYLMGPPSHWRLPVFTSPHALTYCELDALRQARGIG